MWKLILERLFDKGLITDSVLNNCVAGELISEDEKKKILSN
jgi:hypothetical protein